MTNPLTLSLALMQVPEAEEIEEFFETCARLCNGCGPFFRAVRCGPWLWAVGWRLWLGTPAAGPRRRPVGDSPPACLHALRDGWGTPEKLTPPVPLP